MTAVWRNALNSKYWQYCQSIFCSLSSKHWVPWWWRQQTPLKCRKTVTTQKTADHNAVFFEKDKNCEVEGSVLNALPFTPRWEVLSNLVLSVTDWLVCLQARTPSFGKSSGMPSYQLPTHGPPFKDELSSLIEVPVKGDWIRIMHFKIIYIRQQNLP
jgi:hypothetical protein